MKHIIKISFLFAAITIVACTKNDLGGSAGGKVETQDYVFNNITKSFEPNLVIGGKITSNNENAVLFLYLVREKGQDTLLQMEYFKPADRVQEYDFSISPANMDLLKKINLIDVKGIRVLVRNSDQSTYEGMINIKYFDPTLPQLSNFPTSVTLSQPAVTSIKGNITAAAGVKKIYVYDDNSGANSFTVVDSIDGGQQKEMAINYEYKYNVGAERLKFEIVDAFGRKVTSPVITFTNPLGRPNPAISFDSLIIKYAYPDLKSPISGTITTDASSSSTIADIKVYLCQNNTQTSIALSALGMSVPSPAANIYKFTMTDFPYKLQTGKDTCKVVVTDSKGRVTSGTINLSEYNFYCWKNRIVTTQGDSIATPSTTSFFTGEPDNPLRSSCDLLNGIITKDMIKLVAYTSTVPAFTFYNPGNTGSIQGNYNCNGILWNEPVANLNTTSVRVLQSGSATIANGRGIYDNYATITDLSSATFTGVTVPSGNTAKFDGTSAQATGVFTPSLTVVTGDNKFNLIWARYPTVVGGGTLKNILIKVNSVVLIPKGVDGQRAQGGSRANCDIMMEK